MVFNWLKKLMPTTERDSWHLVDVRYEIAPMRERDLPDIVILEELTGLSPWGYESYRAELLTMPRTIMRVARAVSPAAVEGRIVGFIAARVTLDELHINNVATHPDFRRIHVGARLMYTALVEGRVMGATSSFLEVRATNIAAQTLYTRLGFQVVGRRRDYYSFPREDALIMSKSLGELVMDRPVSNK
jgi:[ribosomal protein S18]-alanine N-acetyltransferase